MSLEGSNRAPCLIRWPGRVPAGKVSNELVHLVDTFTTLLLAAGAKVPDDRQIDGMDMREFLLADAEEACWGSTRSDRAARSSAAAGLVSTSIAVRSPLGGRPDQDAEAGDRARAPHAGRSSASAGRSLIRISSLTKPFPRPRVRALGTRSARPVRRQAVSSRCSAPRPLDVQGLVNRLVRDPHRLIIGEIDPEPVSDLLRAPRLPPAAIRAAAVTPATPAHLGAGHSDPVRSLHGAGETVLDVSSQLAVGGELRCLRTLGAQIGVPLRDRGAILKRTTASRGIAAQLAGDRRR
jgi:hypothetical protein